MWRKLKQRAFAAGLILLGLAPAAQAQSSFGSGPQICPLFDDFLTPTFLDFIYPGLSTHLG